MQILILILIILFICLYLYLSIVKKQFFDKKTILYSIPLFFIALITYITGYLKSFPKFTFISFFDCVVASIKIFAFEIEPGLVQPYYDSEILYQVCLNIIIILGGLTLISTILGFFKMKLINFFKVKWNIHKGKDIVIGYTELGLGYAKRNPGSILLVDPTIHKLTKEEKKLLFETNIPFMVFQISDKKFNHIRNKNGVVNVIYFDDSRYLNKVYELADTIKVAENNKIVISVLCDPKYKDFIGESLHYHCSRNKHVVGYAIDKYELISRNFSMNYCIAGFLPEGFIKDALLQDGKEINVHIIGFGNMGNAILKTLICNNQFLTMEDGKFKVCPVNYYLYDRNKETFKNPLITLDKNFDTIMDVKTISKPAKTFNIYPCEFDIREKFLDLYKGEDENSFDMFIVCLDSSLRNAAVAKKLSEKIKNKNSVVLYNVDYKSEAYEETKRFKPFGFKNEFLTHKLIINDTLGNLATRTNKTYQKSNSISKKEDFDNLQLYEKISNIYFHLADRAKLNLVGLTFTDDKTVVGLTKEQFDEIFPTYKKPEYKNYYETKLQNVIARIEHERWNTFNILQGFTPLELTDYTFKNRSKCHKDLENKKHGCLTTYEDLDKVNREIYENCKENNIQVTFEQVETYKYDFELVADIYDSLTKSGFKIIKK